ncbi:MAG: uroporphyrinogen-III synthase [Bacteroidales bacterium]|nr:uroporphyrinogen-III synthase [Candidatus Liminaster caballi]
MKVKSILVSQPAPPEKSPYYELEKKFGVTLTFKQFIRIESLSAKEFRAQKIFVPDYTAIVFTSRTAVDHFFSLCTELRAPIHDELQYFCLNETIALYLQKYITYRKRKVHFSKVGKIEDMALVMKKHNTEKFLMPVADISKTDVTVFTKAKVKVTLAVMYRTVSADITPEEIKSYDMLCLFTPMGIQSLYDNDPSYQQGEQLLAIFGPAAQAAAQAKELRIDISAPTMECPSMPAALHTWLLNNNK